MTPIEDLAPAGLLVAGLGWFGHVAVQWLRNRSADHSVDRNVEAKLEEHWTKTMLQLVDTLRDELAEAKKELSSLRPMEARIAHLGEALDHIHALLASKGDEERRAAERRARAFMRKMRGDDARGEMRNAVQTQISAKRIIRDEEGAIE